MSMPIPLPVPEPPSAKKAAGRRAKECRACGAVLEVWEEREGFCDDCLRAHAVR